jgi:SAM-dependent methyltransferase
MDDAETPAPRAAFDHLQRIVELQTENERLHERCVALEQIVRDHDLLPVPPTPLRVRVGGWEDIDHFLGVGRKINWDVKRLLAGVRRSLSEFTTVLDFGCGCGRLTRHLRPSHDQRIIGCDVDAEAISWCRDHLTVPGMEFFLTNPEPPLPFDASAFDLALAISVFTHLPEQLQDSWLDELHRVLVPGGLLIASVHGETLLPQDMAAEMRTEFHERGFLYVTGFGTPGLPDYYQTSYQLAQYVRAHWERHGFELAFWLPRGINNHQDAYVLVRI